MAGLEAGDVFCRRVKVDVASHSPQVDALHDDLVAALAGLRPRPAVTPFVSTVTGALEDGAALDAEYWARNLRQPVLFAAVRPLLEEGHGRFVELSPHPVLLSAVDQSAAPRGEGGDDGRVRLPRRRRGPVDGPRPRRPLRRRPRCGLDQVHHRPSQPASLPRYPWQHERYWVDVPRARHGRARGRPDHPVLGWRQPVADPSAWCGSTSSTPVTTPIRTAHCSACSSPPPAPPAPERWSTCGSPNRSSSVTNRSPCRRWPTRAAVTTALSPSYRRRDDRWVRLATAGLGRGTGGAVDGGGRRPAGRLLERHRRPPSRSPTRRRGGGRAPRGRAGDGGRVDLRPADGAGDITDVSLSGPAGPVATIRGLQLAPAARATEGVDDWCYRVEWYAKAVTAGPRSLSGGLGRRRRRRHRRGPRRPAGGRRHASDEDDHRRCRRAGCRLPGRPRRTAHRRARRRRPPPYRGRQRRWAPAPPRYPRAGRAGRPASTSSPAARNRSAPPPVRP